MAASYQQVYKINANIHQIQNTIRSRSFLDRLRLSLKSENPTPTGVWYRLHHGVSFTSWGEKVTITLTQLSSTLTEVAIHSECGMPTQIIDWGKNKQIVCNIYEYIVANYGHFPAEIAYSNVQTITQPSNASAQTSEPCFCTKCGQKADTNASFCKQCGNKLR